MSNDPTADIRRIQTILRQLALTDRQYPLLVPDGVYGLQTARAVAVFQQQHGLPPTGRVDPATWQLLLANEADLQAEFPQQITLSLSPYAHQSMQQLINNPQLLALLKTLFNTLAQTYADFTHQPPDGQWDATLAGNIQLLKTRAGLEPTSTITPAFLQAIAALYNQTREAEQPSPTPPGGF